MIHVFVSHIHFLRLLSAGDWGGRRASAGANLLRFFFFPPQRIAELGGENKDEMSRAHFGSGGYRFELSSM